MALQLLLGPSTQHFHSHFRGYSKSHVERVSAGQESCPSLRMDSGCLDDNATYPIVTLQLGSSSLPLSFSRCGEESPDRKRYACSDSAISGKGGAGVQVCR